MTKAPKISWDEAIERCMPLIFKLASQLSKIPCSIIDKDDLINCGLMGLLEALKNYEHGKDAAFSTFAYFRIRGSMLDEIRKYQPHKRNVVEKHKKIQKAHREMAHLKKGPGFNKTLSKICGLSQKEIERVERLIATKRVDANVEQLFKESPTPEKITQLKQQKENLGRAVSKLNETERNVINFRFHRELRLKEIGQKLRLSEARIHQLEKSALFKLRQLVQEDDHDMAA